MSSDTENLQIYKKINRDNYFSNSYIHLTKIKEIHFLFILIEILLNIFEELETFLRGFNSENITKNDTGLNYFSFIINNFDSLPAVIKLIIIIGFILIFDSLYIILTIKRFKKKYIHILIIVDILELFISRTFTLIFFNVFFTLKLEFFVVGCLFLFPHIYLIMNNFLYNHLYYFVPEFIDYPYDEFSSLYDIVLLLTKFTLSVSGTTSNSGLGKFCFLILFFEQIFFSFYYVYLLKNHSYLFMKNSFLNRTKICLFLSKTIILFIALLFGKDEIMSILFLIICISVLLILMAYMYFIYNPFSYIIIKRETPMENIFFYLYILSEKNDFDFVFENKVNEHYEKCGICNLCKRYNKYLNRYKIKKNVEDDEKELFLNGENNQNKEQQLMDLFDIVYDNKSKYFQLIKKIVLNYKHRGKEALNNNSYYYINLSFLIYSDYQKNINLSLNERVLLEVLNQENKSFLDNHESQIVQILLCNEFISLSNKILSQLKDIINSEPNFNKAKKLIDLSLILKKMRNPKYKKNLFSHKLENISNSRHLILICSIVYEEIFNTSLNNSQIPLRDNIQPLEDIFHNNSNKNNKIISLSVDITNKSCKIIRAGKGLYSHVNNNLFDLFPLIFKQFQINHFMSVIFENFEVKNVKNLKVSGGFKKNVSIASTKIVKGGLKSINNKNKKEFIEIKLILCENILSKMFYKLLTLKLVPLFNNDGHHFIIFDGFYNINKNTLITLQDFEENLNPKEKIIGVSEPELEKNNETYSIPFKKYITWQNNLGFEISKISTFNISVKLYNIYIINKKEKDKKYQKKIEQTRESKIEDEDEEEQNSFNKKNTNKVEKAALLEDNASVASQQAGSTFSTGISSIGGRNKKKDNIYEYGGFNKIKKINFIAILVALVILVVEYFYINSLRNQTYNNNISLLQYREFYKLYFQLFSSILAISCIQYKSGCLRIIDPFVDQLPELSKEEIYNYFIIQNKYLAKQMMEKRNYLVNIHKCIGNKKYNQLFGKEITYLRLSQNIISNSLILNLTNIKMQFSEAILVICNSYQLLAEESNYKVDFLNGEKDPFLYMNNKFKENNNYLSDYEKEYYEMILNYKNYFREFNIINDELNTIIISKSSFIKIFIYFYLTFDTSMLVLIGSLMYLYSISFEFILIKIINFINMTMNIKNDDFNFNTTFSKKIENLETILQFYNSDPVKAVQNLNTLYNDYQQFLTSKNKNNAIDMNKKNYKKIIEEDKKNELDNVPKNQRIITRKDVKSLGITFIFIFMYYFNLVAVLGFYVLLVVLWTNYFNQKDNLFSLINKNCRLETGIYRALNGYDLMIFHNLTMDDITSFVLLEEENKEEQNAFIKSFYEDLKLAFNSKKEKNNIANIYEDFEDISEFTCENLYLANNDYIKELENEDKNNIIVNITDNLIKICQFSRVTESKDYRTAYETHFQFIRNGLISIKNFTYEGLINNIINSKYRVNISLFFYNIIIFILEVTNTIPHQTSFEQLISKFKSIFILSHILYFLYDIIAILFVVFFYISGINSLCNQIFVLKKIFKIYEIHE